MKPFVYPRSTQKVAKLTIYKDSGEPAILIKFPFERDIIAQVKTIPHRQFHKESKAKYWTCPLSRAAVEKLMYFGFKLDDELKNYYTQSANINTNFEIPNLKGTLMPFQKEGVALLDLKKGRALLADDMGLGKTIQTIAWLALHSSLRPAIIVTPSALKLNWFEELKNWIDYPKVQILSGKEVNIRLYGQIIIINYDILPDWVEALKEIHPKVVVADECHYFKNRTAVRTKAVIELTRQVPHIICLSGTPIENRPVEIYNAWKVIDPEHCPPFLTFGNRYCGGKMVEYKGASNLLELNSILSSTIMIRRLKKDVLKDLPNKIRSVIPVEITNRKEYNEVQKGFVEFLKKSRGTRANYTWILARIEELKQLTIKGKMKAIFEWIDNFLESGEKLVVFATHIETINTLMKQYATISVRYDGSVNEKTRHQNIKEFQNNSNIRLFIGMLDVEGKPAGVGLTLTVASVSLTVEFQWSPKVHDQAEDREHRIGQKQCVYANYIYAPETIEEHIINVLDRKRRIIDMATDGIIPDQNTLLEELIKEYDKV